jgi:hypothetical protein
MQLWTHSINLRCIKPTCTFPSHSDTGERDPEQSGPAGVLHRVWGQVSGDMPQIMTLEILIRSHQCALKAFWLGPGSANRATRTLSECLFGAGDDASALISW